MTAGNKITHSSPAINSLPKLEHHDLLVELLTNVKNQGYKFITVTPRTHEYFLAKTHSQGKNLRDIFGWNLPFSDDALCPMPKRIMQDCNILEPCGDLLRSKLRISSLGNDLYLHSAFPAKEQNAVFFGPDTYRFARFIRHSLERVEHVFSEHKNVHKPLRILDIGCGTGAGGIVVIRTLPRTQPYELRMNDVSHFALGLPPTASFYSLYQRRHEAGNGERIDQALHAIEESNGTKLKNVFQDISFNTDKLGEEKQKNDTLRHLLEDFAKPELNLRPSLVGSLDVIGNAYEYLIKNFAASGGQKAGEFYTPPEVSDLIAELVDPKEGDEACDPACGSASLLMKLGRNIREKFGSKKYALYGQEAIGSTWSLAKMNMFLHSEDNHKIEWGDTIRNPKLLDADGNLKLFDIVVANPPFSLDKWGHDDAEHDKYGRFRRGIPPKTKGD